MAICHGCQTMPSCAAAGSERVCIANASAARFRGSRTACATPSPPRSSHSMSSLFL
ncbi:efflux RND transporter periplasmic adaptor subunit, partial [Xanthomonas oryzae pv. oryzae]